MTDFGYSTIGSAGNDNPADNFIWCKSTSVPASNGTLTTIQAYCIGLNSVTGTQICMALYTDSGGLPGSLVVANETPVLAGASFGWVSQTFSQSITSGTQYWFGIRCPNYNSTNDDVNVKFDTNGGATENYFINNGAQLPFPGTATGLSNFSNERWSIYGTYTPTGGGGGGTGLPGLAAFQLTNSFTIDMAKAR